MGITSGLIATAWHKTSDTAIRDVGLAVAAGLVGIGGTTLAARHQIGVRPLDAPGYVLLACGPIALLVRRRWPAAVLMLTFVVTLIYGTLNYPGGPIWAPLIIAFITALTSGHRLLAYVSLPVGYIAFVWLDNVGNDRPLPSVWTAIGVAAWMVSLGAVTELVRNRRAYRHANAQRAAQERRSRWEEARRQASDERLGIARELHDVLAHSISLINVQAGVALELMDVQPERARTALTAIKQASKEALVDVQSVLGALRQPSDPVPLTPSASLVRIDELVDRARATGLRVDVRSSGDLATLPAAVDSTGYRIVQEALTNVVRHAGASAQVNIRLRRGCAGLFINVDDDGSGLASVASTPSGGNGITGMRERAAALGGHVAAGPKTSGGYAVQARIPVAASQVVA